MKEDYEQLLQFLNKSLEYLKIEQRAVLKNDEGWGDDYSYIDLNGFQIYRHLRKVHSFGSSEREVAHWVVGVAVPIPATREEPPSEDFRELLETINATAAVRQIIMSFLSDSVDNCVHDAEREIYYKEEEY